MPLAVRKHGLLSGHWTLDGQEGRVASAQKSNPFARTFAIQADGKSLLLAAEFALGRTFRVERSGEQIATIRPVHLFTRRAVIETHDRAWDLPTICFAFWLVVLTWRRAASNSHAPAGSAS